MTLWSSKTGQPMQELVDSHCRYLGSESNDSGAWIRPSLYVTGAAVLFESGGIISLHSLFEHFLRIDELPA